MDKEKFQELLDTAIQILKKEYGPKEREQLFSIRSTRNGWVVTQKSCYDDEGCLEIVGEEEGLKDESDAFVSFLYQILNTFGPTEGKYSRKRIRVITLPGNSYEGPLSKEEKENIRSLKEECESFLENEDEKDNP